MTDPEKTPPPGSDPRIEQYCKVVEAFLNHRYDVDISVEGDDDVAKLGEYLTRLRQTLQDRHREYSLIGKVKDDINAGLTLDEVLNSLYESFHEIIPYNRIGLALIDREDKLVKARWARSDTEKKYIDEDYEAPIEGSSLQKVMETEKPRIINDLEKYLEERPESESTRKIVSEGMLSSLTCPLICGGKAVGFLFFSSRSKNTYQHAHVAFFEEVAAHVSRMIEKGLLYQQQVELNQMKNKLLGVAAHDLRNPLGIVKGFADLIRSGRFGEITKPQKKYLERIIQNSDKMLVMIDDLLDISTIESGKLELRLQKVDLSEYLHDICSLCKMMAERKNISIRKDLPDDLPRITLDQDRIMQVLNNLMSNAVKYSFPETTITLSAETLGDKVKISVTDEGQGIPEEEIPKLFRGYSKTSVQPTGGEKSTGLGLAIVRNIIKAHEGELEINSGIGAGSTFSFTIPIEGPSKKRNTFESED